MTETKENEQKNSMHLNPQVLSNPDNLLFESHGKPQQSALALTLVLLVAAVAMMWFGLTPERSVYRFGVRLTLPDPNWFLFGCGIVAVLVAIFFAIRYVSSRTGSLEIYPQRIRGNGISTRLLPVAHPLSLEIDTITQMEAQPVGLQLTSSGHVYFYPIRSALEAERLLEELVQVQPELKKEGQENNSGK